MSYYWIYGVLVFLFVLSVHKYKDVDVLKEQLQDYINKISDLKNKRLQNQEEQEKKKKLETMMLDFVISNPDIFSLVEVYNKKDE